MEPWKLTNEQLAYDGYRKIAKKSYTLSHDHRKEFEIILEGTSVCVLALTPNNEVILAKQFRPGPGKILCELPGGGVEPGEDPEIAAARELLEETGFKGIMHFITTSWHDAYNTRRRYNFVATNCVKVQEPENDPLEPILVEIISLENFKTHLRSGELTDVATGYFGLDFLHLL